MIVTLREALEFGDALADAVRRREVQPGALDRRQLAGRYQAGVRGRVAIGIQLQHVIEHRAAARQVEVGMVREIDRRRLVRRGLVVDAQFVVVGQRVGHFDGERAWIALFSVRAGEAEFDGC